MIQITNVWKVFNTVPGTEYVLTITLAINYYQLYGFGNNTCWIHSLRKAGEIFIRPILKVTEMSIKRLVQGHTGPSEQESRAARKGSCSPDTSVLASVLSGADTHRHEWQPATLIHQQWRWQRFKLGHLLRIAPHPAQSLSEKLWFRIWVKKLVLFISEVGIILLCNFERTRARTHTITLIYFSKPNEIWL